MEECTIRLESMDLAGCIQFAEQLHVPENATRYILDLNQLRYVTPFGMLWCSSLLRRFRTSLPECEFIMIGQERHGYPAHMGFFRAFGADIGNAPGEAPGSERYLPVTLLDLEELRAEARTNLEVSQNTVERKAHELAAVLVQDDTSELYRTLGFTMTEMCRNVIEHSQAQELGYCAQFWPTKDRVEVAIVDDGIGVREALSSNPFLELESDLHALHMALLPGVSGTAFRGKRRDPYDHWANSGFGLFMTSSICRRGGGFFIASGSGALNLKGDQKGDEQVRFPGTALRLTFRPSELGRLQAMLGELSKEGEKIAREVEGAVPTASGASRMVREQRVSRDE